jgi:histidinol-phosphate aminotransferase
MRNDFQIGRLVRSNILDLVPYSSARDEFPGPASVFLDANENPHNPPLNRYPDPRQRELKKKIALLKGQRVENLFLGNGSDEGIDLLFRVLCEPGKDNVITIDPTYGMYGVCASINGVLRKSVPLQRDFSLDAARILEAVDEHTKLIFLCSPNNPTSNAFDRGAMLEVIDGAPCVVVVDEAYIDFSRMPGLLSLVPEKKNLVVLQTLSKAWGVAGIRLGMVFAHPELIGYLSSVKYPYNVSALTLNEAMKMLDSGDEMKFWVKRILQERDHLASQLGRFRFVERIHPSDANFLLVEMDDPDMVYSYLTNRGIIVRDRSRVPLCEGCLRITVGTEKENRMLLEALSAFEEQSKNHRK